MYFFFFLFEVPIKNKKLHRYLSKWNTFYFLLREKKKKSVTAGRYFVLTMLLEGFTHTAVRGNAPNPRLHSTPIRHKHLNVRRKLKHFPITARLQSVQHPVTGSANVLSKRWMLTFGDSEWKMRVLIRTWFHVRLIPSYWLIITQRQMKSISFFFLFFGYLYNSKWNVFNFTFVH